MSCSSPSRKRSNKPAVSPTRMRAKAQLLTKKSRLWALPKSVPVELGQGPVAPVNRFLVAADVDELGHEFPGIAGDFVGAAFVLGEAHGALQRTVTRSSRSGSLRPYW